jgi:glutathione S-transferase
MASPLPVLYSFRRCPYAMRARLALLASGQVCELREVVLSHKPPEMLAASPKGTVPVLVLPGGQVIEQSLEIMQWALRQADPDHWLPQDATHACHAAELIARCDGPFKADLDRYKYPNRHALPDGLLHRAQGAGFLQALEVQLAGSSSISPSIFPSAPQFLSGTRFGLADAAIAPFVRQFAHTDPQWFAAQTWPRLQSWLQNFEDSALFQQAMVKVPPWVPGQAATVFAP